VLDRLFAWTRPVHLPAVDALASVRLGPWWFAVVRGERGELLLTMAESDRGPLPEAAELERGVAHGLWHEVGGALAGLAPAGVSDVEIDFAPDATEAARDVGLSDAVVRPGERLPGIRVAVAHGVYVVACPFPHPGPLPVVARLLDARGETLDAHEGTIGYDEPRRGARVRWRLFGRKVPAGRGLATYSPKPPETG
jgi:hypothetical protein